MIILFGRYGLIQKPDLTTQIDLCYTTPVTLLLMKGQKLIQNLYRPQGLAFKGCFSKNIKLFKSDIQNDTFQQKSKADAPFSV